jgi:parallel beta-helix repeat protein
MNTIGSVQRIFFVKQFALYRCIGICISVFGLMFPMWAQQIVPIDGQVFTTNTVLVPGAYYLPNGISIGASGVTLDLNGSILRGSNFASAGVTCIGHSDVVIRHGNIQGFYYGVRIESGTNVMVLNNVLSSNWVDPNSLTANPPFLNINVGPDLTDRVNLGGGLFLNDTTAAVISNNAMQFEENGMDLYSMSNSTIISNNASDNTGWGASHHSS